jgi:excisionase family DNA binding protein
MSAHLWSVYTVAHAVGLSVDTIESLIAAEKLAAVQVDGQVMIPLESLLDYIESVRPSPRPVTRVPDG